MWEVLAILLNVILWFLVKIARWKELSFATKEDFGKMAKSGQSILDVANVQDVNGRSVHRIISKHCETTTMQKDRRMKIIRI